MIKARGRDAKGNGGAQATVTASLDEHDGVTDVHVLTDLNVTGKAAQFGGGVMKDVSNRMLAQFADNLSQLIQSGGATGPDDRMLRPAPHPEASACPAALHARQRRGHRRGRPAARLRPGRSPHQSCSASPAC